MDAPLIVVSQLQQAPLDEGVCLLRNSPNRARSFSAKLVVHRFVPADIQQARETLARLARSRCDRDHTSWSKVEAKKPARSFGLHEFSLADADRESLAHISGNIWNCQRHALAQFCSAARSRKTGIQQ
ncbi:hypothetical protein [Bradyrhizobium cenepequi]|uniref:hypothetical protein n=1 Tax=Bradyrhizobium cenepequi TaxID=2821403 RepID=UPI001CE32ACA|nr:hypothetical protein [Bradyrhizobium cenepequi]MCA6108525.1 hypothetical protein [Bradyrhizobium cenepequi]